jgi:hypothetical protein
MQETRFTILFIAAVTSVFCGVNWSASAADNPTNILQIILPQILAQGPEWVAPKSAAEQAEQQRFLTEAYARQQAQQESQNISQQGEILKIYSKDPWRKINNSTNYVGNEGWQQFQGKIQAIEPVGILFQGNFGRVLSISTSTDKNSGLTTIRGEVSNESETNRQNARKSTSQSTQITKTQIEKIYGDDFFLVVNFPYPAQDGNGYERMMAYDTGYITYTNSANHVLTVRKLDYGTPCIKIWSEEEIAAAYAQAEAEREKIEAERKAQRELADAQAERERAAIEEQRKAELAVIEAEKKAKIDKIVKSYQEEADKGDPGALHRLGEFYRDGYGFEKDAVKADEYFKKADAATEALAKQTNEKSKLNEQAARLQKFNRNLVLADKGQVDSMIYVGKCYRDGDSVGKDLSKAREYFQKAADMGSSESAKLLSGLDR